LERSDIVGVYAGLRPLLTGESDQTSKLSREHAVVDNDRGTISIAGGKYTTYRVMARDAIDAAARYLPGVVAESRTADIPLVGAGAERPAHVDPRLWRRYGTLATDVLELAHGDPVLSQPVVDDAPYLGAELVYAATHEGALHLDDFLTRRTRISIETRHRGTRAIEPVTELVGPHLGWDDAARMREARHYRARVEAERDSQDQPDDHTADAARMGAPDVRTGSAE
jgi:glycerol-3-phosphate dehydrogenase